MRPLKIARGALAALAVIAVAAGLVFDWNWLKPLAEDRLSAAAGREVTIESLDVEPGWTSRVILTGLVIANVEARERPFAEVARTEIDVRVLPLLQGDYEFPRVALEQPGYDLYIAPDGAANWRFGPFAREGPAAGALPELGRMEMNDGEVVYRDARNDLRLEGAIAATASPGRREGRLHLDLTGQLRDKAVDLVFTGGSVFNLGQKEESYPVDMALEVGGTSINAEGSALRPLDLAGLDLQLAAKGPTLAAIYQIFGLPLPQTPPYDLQGHLTHEPAQTRFSDFSGTVGQSDLAGSFEVRHDGGKPFLSAEVVSQELRLKDAAALFEAPRATTEQPTGGDDAGNTDSAPVSGQAIRTGRLQAMNMDISWRAESVRSGRLPISSLGTRVRLTDGLLRADPLELGIADGTASGAMKLDGRSAPLAAGASMQFRDLDLRPFFAEPGVALELGGAFFGRIDVQGRGRSFAGILDGLQGDGMLAMRGGSIGSQLLGKIGLDPLEALGLARPERAMLPIRCGRADLKVDSSDLIVTRAIVDAAESVLVAKGRLNLMQRMIDMRLEARAKDFSLIDANAPIHLSGPLSDPDYSIGGLDALPFFETGDQPSLDCDALIGGALELASEPSPTPAAPDPDPEGTEAPSQTGVRPAEGGTGDSASRDSETEAAGPGNADERDADSGEVDAGGVPDRPRPAAEAAREAEDEPITGFDEL
ncbi:AsmA family protein [Minwuia thermotolerans]|uniref:AsmA domain-containing protein n=1 Tax=Minwuia thermotolerans TaxID=2056226 RepID=A0A2M9G188_9PROT|nr:AsmA family protein [Minwuia thermotolerans]PJK29482.1 hypothetical protein CVT23_10485 [Minwuia thermotolerans]